jgi:hypothetical protein
MPVTVTIVGAGGIGSHLVGALAPAIHRGDLVERLGGIVLRIHDSDLVSEQNLAHQRFLPSEVGRHKATSLRSSLMEFESDLMQVEAINKDVRRASDIGGSDLVVVAVDSSQARRVAHASAPRWLDLRCSGDGYIAIDHRVGSRQVDSLTTDQPPMSCQLEGSIDVGNIQFGFMAAAAHGAQWAIQSLREMSGESGAMAPIPQSASISFGTLGRLELLTEVEG